MEKSTREWIENQGRQYQEGRGCRPRVPFQSMENPAYQQAHQHEAEQIQNHGLQGLIGMEKAVADKPDGDGSHQPKQHAKQQDS